MRHLPILCAAGFILCSGPAMAEDGVEVEPGLYGFATTVSMGGQTILEDRYEYCIFEDNNSRTFDELMDELVTDSECDVSNVSFGGGKGSATISCPNTDLGIPLDGQMDGYYSRTRYGATTVAQSPMGGPKVTIKTTADRLSECPDGWTPPEGYSDE